MRKREREKEEEEEKEKEKEGMEFMEEGVCFSCG